jgi:hypothetical protein
MIRYRTSGLAALLAWWCLVGLLPEAATAGLFRRRWRPLVSRVQPTCPPARVCPTCSPQPVCPSCPKCPTSRQAREVRGCAPGAVCINQKIAEVYAEDGMSFLYAIYSATECMDTAIEHHDAADNLKVGQSCTSADCECFNNHEVDEVPLDMMPPAAVPDDLEEPTAFGAAAQPGVARKVTAGKSLIGNGLAQAPRVVKAVQGQIVQTKVVKCQNTNLTLKLFRIDANNEMYGIAVVTNEPITHPNAIVVCPVNPTHANHFRVREVGMGQPFFYTLHRN